MYHSDRIYKLGFKERITVYEYEDLVNSEKVELFKGDPKWDGANKNYKSYLNKGKNEKITTDYRTHKKEALVRKIVKIFFKMLMEDILNGDRVKLGTRAFYLFIGTRATTSPKYKFKTSQQGIDYIPYVRLSKRITAGGHYKMMYMTFTDKYEKKFKRLLKSGKKY